MKQYLDLMVECRDKGIDVFNERTGKTCRTLIGTQLEFNLASGFPAVTSKKLAFKTMMGELLGFFRGYTNAADFRALGCKIWDKNANETKAWLENPYRKGEDDLGRIYGHQWVKWRDIEFVDSNNDVMIKYLESNGYVYFEEFFTTDGERFETAKENGATIYIYESRINQLEKALKTIITNPSDRRIIVSAWNPGELNKAALPPCHIMYSFIPIGDTLSVVMHQRSCDLFLGIPFNIASTGLMLSIMSRLSGLKPGKVILQMVNAHIYEDHSEALEQQLQNPLYELPTLILSDNIKKIENIEDIKGVFTRINPEDIWLENYTCNDAINAPMSA